MQIGKRHTTLIAGFIGNVVEWYDFALYGYLASVISTLFFPSESDAASLLATYGVFAAGFLMRPIGSAVFGWLGDTIGRSRTMFISVFLMFLPTVALGLLPTYEAIGVAAPVLLVVIRLVQGLSVGGEFSSSVVYLVETAPPQRRGRAGSWANTGSLTGMLLGAGAAALATSLLSDAALHEWGWRVPFIGGGVIGGLALYLRRRLPKSPHFQKHESETKGPSPLRLVFTRNRRATLQATAFAAAYGSVFYLVLVYLPNWLADQTDEPLDRAMRVNTLATFLLIPLVFAAAWAGDRLTRRTRIIAGAFAIGAVVAAPLFFLMLKGGGLSHAAGQFGLAAILAAPLGAAPAMFAEAFPADDRLTGYSIAYNLGLGVVGGVTPMTATWLIEQTGSGAAVGVFLSVMFALGAGAMISMRDRSREELR